MCHASFYLLVFANPSAIRKVFDSRTIIDASRQEEFLNLSEEF